MTFLEEKSHPKGVERNCFLYI